ncbi:SUKH-4 family immunity protein [Streptomyces caeruleatus]|uniref:SUKH-4 immunity protein n=1 Tax=Streptomyces caeruleatus TaxID=661399 RepID=A0A101U7H5_9ACTN|nr:SUKH-4 family immunity protein [Streptomyces caeruleatus]KUO05414.1 hypothetical protein AQJ67_08635 [Streptomyces caeruleatus]
MITRKDLETLYSAEVIVTLSPEESQKLRLLQDDSRFLAEIGLPRHAPPFFTTEVSGGPEFLLPIDIPTSSGGIHREVIIGGPPGDAKMRFSLDTDEGFVTLVQLAGKPRFEVANRNLAEFVEFIYLIDSHRRRASDHPDEAKDSLAELSLRLMSINSVVFEEPENWWSIALGHLSAMEG